MLNNKFIIFFVIAACIDLQLYFYLLSERAR